MRVVIFFLCLCYLLPGGYNYLYTGSYRHACSPALPIEKSHAKFTDKKAGYSVVSQAAAGGAGAIVVPDIEEDDTDNLSARKYKLLASYFYAFTCSSILIHLYSRFKTPRPHYRLLTYEYIKQRVLRI
jgi:hypothetical protein